MNHHQLFTVLILCGSFSIRIFSLFSGSFDLHIFSLVQLIVIGLILVHYYSSSRPKASNNTIILFSLVMIVIVFSFINIHTSSSLLLSVVAGLLAGVLALGATGMISLSGGKISLFIQSRRYLYVIISLVILIILALVYPFIFGKVSASPGGTMQQQIPGMIDTVTINADKTITVGEESEIEPEKRLFVQYFAQNEEITYGSIIPLLWEKYNGEISSQNIDFSYIDKESVLYPSFLYAYEAGMIGATLDPENSVKCGIFFVMVGLAQEREVVSSAETILDDYRDSASDKGLLAYGCEQQEQILLGSMLP